MLSSCSITEQGKCQKGSRRAVWEPRGPGSEDAAVAGARRSAGSALRPRPGSTRDRSAGCARRGCGRREPKMDISALSLQPLRMALRHLSL